MSDLAPHFPSSAMLPSPPSQSHGMALTFLSVIIHETGRPLRQRRHTQMPPSQPEAAAPLSLLQVAFDPVDGSSIYPANWAVGTIFGIWPGASTQGVCAAPLHCACWVMLWWRAGGKLLGCSGRDQVAAGFSVFGPRTVVVLACRSGDVPKASLD